MVGSYDIFEDAEKDHCEHKAQITIRLLCEECEYQMIIIDASSGSYPPFVSSNSLSITHAQLACACLNCFWNIPHYISVRFFLQCEMFYNSLL